MRSYDDDDDDDDGDVTFSYVTNVGGLIKMARRRVAGGLVEV